MSAIVGKKHDLRTRPKIFLRLRPPLLEHELGDQPFCEVQRDTITYQYCIGKTVQREIEGTTRFDHIFAEACTQADIFDHLWPEVEQFLDSGRTATVMMYGATGSGKTHTMEGQIRNNDERGFCVRVLTKIFETFEQKVEKFVVGWKFVQVYNKRVDDLISGQKGVEMQSLAEGCSKNVTQQRVESVEGFIQAYEQASSRRMTAANQVHGQSSRSHSMLQLTIKWVPKASSAKHISVLNLVDLAGSERYALGPNPTSEERLRSEESIAINQGLSFLGKVVDQLVKKARTKDPHIAIHFRDHNLTKLLASSLKGDGALCLVLCAPNVASDRAENVRTIRFGMTCLTLPVQPKRNLDTETAQVQELIHSQSRQKEDIEHDTALHVEEKAQLGPSDDVAASRQSNNEEVEQLQQDLASVRLRRIEQDVTLAEGNQHMVVVRFELEQDRQGLEVLRSNSSCDSAQLKATQTRLEAREREIVRLECYAGQLQELVQDLSARRGDYEQLRAELEEAREVSKAKAESEQARQAVVDLEAKLASKQKEIDTLSHNVESVFADKQELENNVSSFLQLLERRTAADVRRDAAHELSANLGGRIRLAQLALEVESDCNESGDELRHLVQELNVQLQESESQAASANKLVEDLDSQADNYLTMLPAPEREVVRRYVHAFRRQAPVLHRLQEEEHTLAEELSRWHPLHSARAQRPLKGDAAPDMGDPESEAEEEAGIGFDLDADLSHLQTLQQNDELKRFVDGLPDTAGQAADFLGVYPSFGRRFVDLQGLNRIAELMQNTRHDSTKGNLSRVVVATLAAPEAAEAACECDLIDTYLQWLSQDGWTSCHQSTVYLALRAVRALARHGTAKATFLAGGVLQPVVELAVNSRVQDVVEEACKCLGALCPTVQQTREACGDAVANQLCGALVEHFYNASQQVVKSAAECTAQLCNGSKKFKKMFMQKHGVSQMVREQLGSDGASASEEMDCLDHALARIRDKDFQDEFALVILSLILGCSDADAKLRLTRVSEAAMTKVYEALAFFHATRVRDQDSVFVTSKSKEFPYQGRILRGTWDCMGAGGDSRHTSYHRNPMFKLHVGRAAGQCAQVSIVILHLDQQGFKQGGRLSWAYVDIVPRKTMQEKLEVTSTGDDAAEEDSMAAAALEEAQWQDGLKPIAFHCRAGKSHQSATGMKAAATFELAADSDYVLIPHTDVNNMQGRFVIAVVSQAVIEVERLSDEHSLYSHIGIFNSASTGCDDFHLSSWRNGPQLSISAAKDCLINVAVCYRDQDDALSALHLHAEEDRSLKTVNAQFEHRPQLQLSLANDERCGTKRFVGQRPRYVYGTGCLRCSYFLRAGKFYSLSVSMRTSNNAERQAQDQNLPFRVQIVSTTELKCQPISEPEEWFTFSTLFTTGSHGSERTFELRATSALVCDESAKHELQLLLSVCEASTQSFGRKELEFESESEEDSSSSSPDHDCDSKPNSRRICCCTVEQEGKVLETQRYYMDNEWSELPIRVTNLTSIHKPLLIRVNDEAGPSPTAVFRLFGFATFAVDVNSVGSTASRLDVGQFTPYAKDPQCGDFIQRALVPLVSRSLHDPAMQPESAVQITASDKHTQQSDKVLVDKHYLEKIYMTITMLANKCSAFKTRHDTMAREHAAVLERKDAEYSKALEERRAAETQLLQLQTQQQRPGVGPPPDTSAVPASPQSTPSRPASRAPSADRGSESNGGRTPSPITFPLRPSDRQHLSPTFHPENSPQGSPGSRRFLTQPPRVPGPGLADPPTLPSKACSVQ